MTRHFAKKITTHHQRRDGCVCKKKHEEEMMPLLLMIIELCFCEISQIYQLSNEVGLSGVTIERTPKKRKI